MITLILVMVIGFCLGVVMASIGMMHALQKWPQVWR